MFSFFQVKSFMENIIIFFNCINWKYKLPMLNHFMVILTVKDHTAVAVSLISKTTQAFDSSC